MKPRTLDRFEWAMIGLTAIVWAIFNLWSVSHGY